MLIGFINLPLLGRVIGSNLPPGIPEEEIKRTIESILRYQRIGVYLTPVGVLLKWLCLSASLFMSCILLDLKADFKHLFGLVSQCGLITFLQELANFLIIRARGGLIRTIDDLSPRLGLDLILTGLGKPLMLTLNYFSIFNLWHIVILTFGVASLCHCTKLRAFVATIPTWLLPLAFALSLLPFRG